MKNSNSEGIYTKNFDKCALERDFSQIPNEIIRDENLSCAAFKIGIFLLSLPSTWKITKDYIWKNTSLGKQRVAKALNELEEAGYIRRKRLKNGNLYSSIEYSLSGRKLFKNKDENESVLDSTKTGRSKTERSVSTTDIEYGINKHGIKEHNAISNEIANTNTFYSSHVANEPEIEPEMQCVPSDPLLAPRPEQGIKNDDNPPSEEIPPMPPSVAKHYDQLLLTKELIPIRPPKKAASLLALEEKNPEAVRLAKLLYSLINDNLKAIDEELSLPKPNFVKWATDMDRLLRLPTKKTPAKVEAILRWALRDSFWSSKILSPANFRKHFERLAYDKSSKSGNQRELTPEEIEYSETLPF